jgi:hypothetical protein
MEEQGRVVATHRGPRTVDLFKETAKEVQAFSDIKAKADAGDRDAKIEYTLKCADQGWYKLEELKKAVAELGELSAEQSKSFNGVLANLMGKEVQNTVEAKRYLEMLDKGLVPTDEQSATHFYEVIVRYAAFKKDLKVFESAFPELEKRLSQNPRAAGYLDYRRKQLASMKAGQN